MAAKCIDQLFDLKERNKNPHRAVCLCCSAASDQLKKQCVRAERCPGGVQELIWISWRTFHLKVDLKWDKEPLAPDRRSPILRALWATLIENWIFDAQNAWNVLEVTEAPQWQNAFIFSLFLYNWFIFQRLYFC